MIIGGGAALGPLLAGYTIDWSGYGAVVVEGVALFLVSAAAYGWARWRSTGETVQASSHSLSHG
jgi:MFS transporter, DHA1 family, inner membrane transport protein